MRRNEMKEVTEIVNDEKKIKLIRGQRGAIGWEISISGQEMEKIISEIQTTDEKLKTLYQGPQGAE